MYSVSQGKAFAYVGCLVTISHIIKKEGLTNLKISGATPYKYDFSIAVHKNFPELFSIISKAMNSIEQHERGAIQDKWIALSYEQKIDYSLIWKILVSMALVLVFIFVWFKHLRQLNQSMSLARDES